MSKSKFKPKNPLPAISNFFATKPHIWLSFVIPFAVMAGAYMYFGVYPVENKSVLSLDLNAQYAYYFAYMKDVIAGHDSLLYSWSRNLSGEFVGIIGYYLFSPFNIFVWIFPLSHLTEGLLLMILTKIGFIGVTMSVYLSMSRGFSKHTTVMFSAAYALTSYNIVQTMNPMWLDGVMALPLVIMGIESLLKHGRYKLLTFSLVYSFVTCFYIGYMVGIFAALYFVYYAVTSRKPTKDNAVLILKRGGLFAAIAVIAVLLSAFILLPVYSALSMGKFEFSNPDYSIRSNFSIFEMTRKLFPNSYDTVRMDGMPFVYAGTLALILLPAYFFCDRIRRVRRLGGIVFITVLVFSMIITPIDMFWHGMQVPNWLPYRYSFMLCFLLLAFGAEAFENIKKIPRKTLGTAAVFYCMLLIYWENADTINPSLGSDGRDVFNWFATVIPSLVLMITFAAFLIMARDRLTKHNMFTATLVALVSLELFFNVQNSIEKQNEDIIYSSRDSFNSVMIPTREVTDKINKADDGFFRMEKTYIRSANDPMALRMKGVTHSSSMLNDKSIALLKNLGYAARSHMSRYSGATPLTDDLFGFKYILSCKDNKHGNIKTANDITVNENVDVMPIAYLTNPKMLNYELADSRFQDDVFTNQNQMLSYMLGDENNQYFVKMEFEDKRPQNLSFEQLGDGYSSYTRGDEPVDAHIEYDVIADKSGDFYMYFPSRYERKCNLWVDGEFIGQVYETDHHHIQYLGYFEEGQKFMMTLSLPQGQDKVFFREENIMRLDRELLEKDIERLHKINENTVFEAVTNRHLKITTNHIDDMLLFTSIPVEPGWKATLNGKTVNIEELIEINLGTNEDTGEDILAGALMAIAVPGGSNVIELKFFPNMMPLGICLTMAGVGGLFLLRFAMAKVTVTARAKRRIGKGNKSDANVKNADAKDDYDGFDSDYVNLHLEDEFEDVVNASDD